MTDARSTLFTLLHRADLVTPEQLLAQALPIIVADLGVSDAHVYRVTHRGMVVWYSTDPTLAGTFAVLNPTSPFQRALDTGSSQVDSGQGLSIVPLLADNQIFGLLALNWQTAPDTAKVETLSAILGILLRSKQLAHLLERQNAITDKLNNAVTLTDVAGVIASSLLEKGQFTSINRFERDAEGKLTGVTVVASANPRQAISPDAPLSVSLSFLQMVYDSLQKDGELLISDFETDERLDAASKQWLEENQIRATYNLPLYLNDALYAFVSIVDSKYSLAPSIEERKLYRNAIGQAASIIEKRRLLEQTTATLEETRVLYGLSQDLMQSEDIPDVLRTLYKYFGHDTLNINVSEFTYDEHELLTDARVRFVCVGGEVRAANFAWFESLTEEERENAQEHARNVGSSLEILEDYEQEQHRVLALRQLLAQGVRSSVTIPLLENGLRTRQITLTWSRPRAFDESIRRLLETAQPQIALVLKNRQLLHSIQQSAQQSGEEAQTLSLINKLITITNTTQDEQVVMQRAAEIIHQVTRSDHVGIVRHNTRGENAMIAAEHPITGASGTRINTGGRSITSLLAKNRSTVVMNDVMEQDFISPSSVEPLLRMGVRSTFFVPMFDLNQELIGSIGIDYFKKQNPIDPRVVELAETIASQTAISLQKLRLLEETEQRAVQMEQIAEFSQSVQSSLQIPDILDAALRYSHDIVPHEYMAILLYDRADQLLKRTAIYESEQQSIELPGTSVSAESNSLAWHVWQSREPIRTSTLQTDWQWTHPHAGELGNLVVVPLVSGSLDLGVLEFGTSSDEPYSSTDLAALTQMANQIAIAIGNAETYEQSQKVARNKALSNEIASRLQRQADINELLQTTAEELGRAVGAKRVRIRVGTNFQKAGEPRP